MAARVEARALYFCFDCGEATASPMTVWRRADGKPVDFTKDPETTEGTFRTLVHRTNTGCNRGRTASEIREGAAR